MFPASVTRHLDRASRRQFLHAAGMGIAGVGACSWLPAFASDIATHPDRRRQCLLLWMAGGPSQLDTFDMKPDHAHGGEFRPISTNVAGIQICEHLPLLAQHADQLAIVRGVTTKEGDHLRGTQLMRTGKTPGGPLRYPAIGCSIAKELELAETGLPTYVSVGDNPFAGMEGFGPGFLGPRFAPTTVGGASEGPGPAANGMVAKLGINHLESFPGVDPGQVAIRRDFWTSLQQSFLAERRAPNGVAQDTVYRRAMRMMDGEVAKAFDLSQEPDAVRQSYGTGVFGQGCLLARRLLERGVSVVEVTLGAAPDAPVGWDTHQDNFKQTRALLGQLDSGWGTLMRELSERGLLETTTILWMGEFGRTPVINPNGGRDHFPQAWTCVFGGGGIRGGQSYGSTSVDGMEVTDGLVTETNLLATLCRSVGIDPATENTTPDGRPVKIVEGEPIEAILS